MRKMKRIASMALAATMVASALTACGGGTQETKAAAAATTAAAAKETAAAEKTADPVEIDFWHSMGSATGELVQEICDEFNASQDEVKVNCIYQGDYTAAGTKLQAAVSGGNAPHVAQIEQRIFFLTSNRLMMQMTASTLQICMQALWTSLGTKINSFLFRTAEAARLCTTT